uniref:Uncharacterized protein n=1 Tax=Ascaris lumbricoides TaxID=6252 RepID=A0A0M3HST0_ASCLU
MRAAGPIDFVNACKFDGARHLGSLWDFLVRKAVSTFLPAPVQLLAASRGRKCASSMHGEMKKAQKPQRQNTSSSVDLRALSPPPPSGIAVSVAMPQLSCAAPTPMMAENVFFGRTKRSQQPQFAPFLW